MTSSKFNVPVAMIVGLRKANFRNRNKLTEERKVSDGSIAVRAAIIIVEDEKGDETHTTMSWTTIARRSIVANTRESLIISLSNLFVSYQVHTACLRKFSPCGALPCNLRGQLIWGLMLADCLTSHIIFFRWFMFRIKWNICKSDEFRRKQTKNALHSRSYLAINFLFLSPHDLVRSPWNRPIGTSNTSKSYTSRFFIDSGF